MTKPTHTAYTVIRAKKDDQKDYWLPVGSAWTNRDGSFNIRLNALPVNGELCVRPRKEGDDAEG